MIKRQGAADVEGGLTREIAGIIIGLVAGTVALCWVLNTVFLERYYVMNKENVLLSGFTTIDAASEDGSLDDSSFDVTFDNLCANGNITVMVISPNTLINRSSVNDTAYVNRVYGHYFRWYAEWRPRCWRRRRTM